MITASAMLAATAPLALATPASAAGVPAFDHVVVVILENHSAAQVLGNPAAPYINSVAASGATMTRSYAVARPSQPNYLALFAGSTYGVTTNDCPLALDGPTLATSLAAAGRSFALYSEDLPSEGFTGCYSGGYARKHNPVVDFASVPASANQPLSAFPTDYSALPSVSFLVPNLQHDMHDGTVGEADAWLQSTIEGYRVWAAGHNSLLVLTFDEDDDSSANRIPTVLSGANVVPGSYADLITHYTVLRTLTDANGVAPIGLAADTGPILGVWGDPGNRQPTASFTAGAAGLTATFDGSASSDPDGPIASYAWTFGDGTTGSGVSATHTYAQPGTYTVTLAVTDGGGVVGSRTAGVAVGNGLAADAFGRTVTGGWGGADVGGPWATSGSTAQYAVGSGTGTMRIAAAGGPSAVLRDIVSSDTDLTTTLTTDKPATGSGLYLYVVGRRVAGAGDYRAKVRLQSTGSVTLLVERVTTASAETYLTGELALPGLAYAAGLPLRVRTQVTGTNPTTVRAKVWRVGTAEPAAWQASATDATAALQAPGQLGLVTYLSSAATNAPITLLVDDLVASTSAPPPPVDSPPTPAFTWSAHDLAVTFDATGSVDAEGPIAAYSWAYGDGATGAGATPSHVYGAPGSYAVTLSVTDSGGLTRSTSRTVVVTAPPPVDGPPTAELTASVVGRDVAVDGTASHDAEGAIASYTWDFGDGTTGIGPTSSRTYATDGTYVIALTVLDSAGQAATATRTVTVTSGPPPDAPPTASFVVTATDLAAGFDATASADAEGPIASYAWDFGDGTAGSGATTTHTYAAAGTYTTTLTVTDSSGQTAATSRVVAVTAPPPPDTPPTAAFSASTSDLRVALDASASSDAEGPIASYAWTFGDATSGTGATASHTYAAAGTYLVSLVVTDAGGLTATTSRSVTVTAPPPPPPPPTVRAADEFGRTVAGGWGSADVGGPWTVGGSSSLFAVAGGVGTVRVSPGSGPTAFLRSVSSSDTDVALTLTTDRAAAGSGLYLYLAGRRVAGAGDYRAKVRIQANGTVSLLVQRVSAGNVETNLSSDVVVPAAAYAVGTRLRVRLLVTGTSPTTVRAKVWKVGSTEPAWQVSATDATAGYQAAGQIGFIPYLSSAAGTPITVSVDSLDARASTP